MAESLSERDKKVIWHPYTPQKYAPDPIPVSKASGVWLHDENDNRYIDAISSWWVTIHGHAHPYIAEKIYRQALELEQVIFAGFTHKPAVELAERLISLLPGNFSKIFYSDNGSTATEVAIKMALQYWRNKGVKNRNRVLALTNSYHGDTFGAMSVSGRSIFTAAFSELLFDVTYAELASADDFRLVSAAGENVSKDILDECACAIYEPLVQGAGGMLMHNVEVLDNLIRECRKHSILCIADEVMTGFGRTGKLFASDFCREKPDLICLSKGITGGTMAMGVTACTRELHDAFVNDDPLTTFFHGHSYTANPLACAAALASLDLFESTHVMESISRISTRNADFKHHLEKEKSRLNIRNVRQTGTILAFDIIAGDDGYTNKIKEQVTNIALKKGVYLRPLGNTVYIMPPFCISDEELRTVFNVLEEVLAEIKRPG